MAPKSKSSLPFVAIFAATALLPTSAFHLATWKSAIKSLQGSTDSSVALPHALVQLSLSHPGQQNDEPKEQWINPFEQQKSIQKDSFESRMSSTVEKTVLGASPRKRQMNELMSDMLRCVNDDRAMKEVLSRYDEMLMEPFQEDYDPDFETDSIYEVGMTKQDKILRYEKVISERIESAQNGSVKTILQRMKCYVLERCNTVTEGN